jgi:hypothetical protein
MIDGSLFVVAQMFLHKTEHTMRTFQRQRPTCPQLRDQSSIAHRFKAKAGRLHLTLRYEAFDLG